MEVIAPYYATNATNEFQLDAVPSPISPLGVAGNINISHATCGFLRATAVPSYGLVGSPTYCDKGSYGIWQLSIAPIVNATGSYFESLGLATVERQQSEARPAIWKGRFVDGKIVIDQSLYAIGVLSAPADFSCEEPSRPFFYPATPIPEEIIALSIIEETLGYAGRLPVAACIPIVAPLYSVNATFKFQIDGTEIPIPDSVGNVNIATTFCQFLSTTLEPGWGLAETATYCDKGSYGIWQFALPPILNATGNFYEVFGIASVERQQTEARPVLRKGRLVNGKIVIDEDITAFSYSIAPDYFSCP